MKGGSVSKSKELKKVGTIDLASINGIVGNSLAKLISKAEMDAIIKQVENPNYGKDSTTDLTSSGSEKEDSITESESE